MTDTNLLDLDAARREVAHPEGIRVRFGGEDYLLPSELPLDVFDPFLSDDLDLVAVIRDFSTMGDAKAADGKAKSEDEENEGWAAALFAHPNLPRQFIHATHAALEALFGPEDYVRFRANRPSLGDYGRLIQGLVKLYSVSLGEAFASLTSADGDGQTSNPTSPAPTPESTPGASTDPRALAADSSASDVPVPSSVVSLPMPS